jgi:UDP-N-acetylglucosamine 2-epimerase (non-hydrolysing)
VREVVGATLQGIDNVVLLEPLDYVPFVHLMKRSYLLLTDSGGVQEEGPSLDKPVLVMRNVTERQEGEQAGTIRLVGTDAAAIVAEASRLLTDRAAYDAMASRPNPYGDGTAARKTVARLLQEAK